MGHTSKRVQTESVVYLIGALAITAQGGLLYRWQTVLIDFDLFFLLVALLSGLLISAMFEWRLRRSRNTHSVTRRGWPWLPALLTACYCISVFFASSENIYSHLYVLTAAMAAGFGGSLSDLYLIKRVRMSR